MEASKDAVIMELKAPETQFVAEWELSTRYCATTLATKHYSDGLNNKI